MLVVLQNLIRQINSPVVVLGVFDASAFRSPVTSAAAAGEESALLQNTLLDTSNTDANSNNLVLLVRRECPLLSYLYIHNN